MKISGKILKLALKKHNISQENAGNKLGVARQTVGIWMKSELINDDVVRNVKEKLGIDLTEYTNDADFKGNDLPPIVQKLIQSKDELIQELKQDKERLFHLLQDKDKK